MEMTVQVTVDCTDPRRLVAFWSEALGYVPEPPPEAYATWRAYWLDSGVPEGGLPGDAGESAESIIDPAGLGPRVWFQVVPEPKTVKNRVHLDLKVGGGPEVPAAERARRVDSTVARLTAAGAGVLRRRGGPGEDHYAVLLEDPEGNEFCVV